MKKAFTDDVRELVKRRARREKMAPASDDHLALVRSVAAQTFAWLRLAQSLDALAADPLVTPNPVAVEFVQAVRALVDGAMLADDARQVLEPVDSLLPNGMLGERHRKTQRDRRKGKPAGDPLDATRDSRIRALHAGLTAASRHDATSATAAEFGVSRSTVQRALRKTP